MKKAINIIMAIAFVLIIIWEAHAFGEHTLLESQRKTYAFCMRAHADINASGADELKCGQMQADTNTEFICNNTGDYCWLEVK